MELLIQGLYPLRPLNHKEGMRGMYRGLHPELFRGVGGSLVIVAYDRIKLIYNLLSAFAAFSTEEPKPV